MTNLRTSDLWRWLAPLAYARRPMGLAVTAGCLLALAFTFFAEELTPPAVVFGALGFIPVLVAVWLLSRWQAVLVTLAAIAIRIVVSFPDHTPAVTVGIEVLSILGVAAFGRFASEAISAYWVAQAMEFDRARIARELHDGTIQSLFAVGIALRSLRGRVDDDSRKGIDEALTDLDRVIRDLRNYVFGLRPTILSDQQLGPALEQLVYELRARTRVAAAVDIDQMVAAGLSHRAGDVIQLAREALSNLGRHSGARTCQLSLRRDGELAVLEVRDDGHGFDSAHPNGGGTGLANMRDRAAVLGGHMTIDAAPTGTTVRISIPMQ